MTRLASLTVFFALAAFVAFADVTRSRSVRSGQPTGSTRLEFVLNVPAFRLDVVSEGRLVRSYMVAVGAPEYPTPIGTYHFTELTWNPAWIPPAADWARGKKPVAPGWDNPMGRVKIRFWKSYYLHGSPEESSIGRARSHGCVRMRNVDAIEVGRLLQAAAHSGHSASDVEAIIASPSQTRTIPLGVTVPFTTRYDLVEVRDGELLLHADIYQRGRRTVRADAERLLLQHGYGQRLIDSEHLDALVRAARDRPVRVPLDAVLKDRLPP